MGQKLKKRASPDGSAPRGKADGIPQYGSVVTHQGSTTFCGSLTWHDQHALSKPKIEELFTRQLVESVIAPQRRRTTRSRPDVPINQLAENLGSGAALTSTLHWGL
jgi:hypothetical protein